MTSTRPVGRDRAVDATRGLALLGSTVATAVVWLGSRQLGPGYRPLGGTDLDRTVDGLLALLVDNRVLAVFALLLGFGLAVRLQGREREEGEGRTVLRRAGLLVLLGGAHAAVLLEADVLATLAVVLVLTYPLVRARTRTHVVVGLLVVPALLLHGVADGLGGSAGFPDAPTDYLLSVLDRVGTWLLALVLLPFTQAGLVLAAVAGVRLARGGWLLDPGSHRRGLLVVGVLGAVVGLAGAGPYARVVAAGTTGDVAVAVGAGALSSLTGPAGAVGAVCLSVLALAAARDRLPGAAPAGVVLAGLALLGRSSLPTYLVHSLLLALVLAPWAGARGATWGSAAVVGLGAGLWLVSLAAGVGLAAARSGQPTDRQGLARSSAT